jgi:hypothetical protein
MGIQEIIKYFGKTWQKNENSEIYLQSGAATTDPQGEGGGRTRAEADG